MESHSVLAPLGPDIWVADGPAINFYGIPFPTRMTVIRLSNGDLFLHSPIAYSEELEAELRKLGTIRHLVSPNWIHYAHIGEWQRAVPGSVAWASPGVKKRAASRGVSIDFDHDLADSAPQDWDGQIRQLIVHGKAHTEVVFFHLRSCVLILTDLIENMHARTLPLWVRPLAWLAGILAPNGKMPFDIWMSFSGSRDRLARALGQLLDWGPKIVVLAHGDILRDNAAQRLREGFRNLAPAGPVNQHGN
ncbi:DUF4336 domain-containing protein [Rhodobacteraceae bacterium NNCM2]|nr:DUF4336 domain-containing protein [Coraliihabitans acroporae]